MIAIDRMIQDKILDFVEEWGETQMKIAFLCSG